MTELTSFVNVEISGGRSELNKQRIVGALNEIDAKADKARHSIDGTRKSTAQFGTSAQSNTKKAAQGFKTFGDQADRSNRIVDRSSKAALKSVVALATAGLSAAVVARKMISSYADFETALAGVRKTTGLVGKDLDSFANRVTQISKDLPITTAELLELSQAAGQMGVKGAKNLEVFSLTVAKLGRASDLAGEEAAKSLARILNVTGENILEVQTLGSVIVALGNNIAASESEIASMTNEVARATSVYDIGSAKAAALAGAMSSIGVEAQLGGSSVGRAMQAINLAVQKGGEDLKHFARTMGLNAEALKETFENDKVGAFVMFLEAVERQGLSAAASLEEVGLGGQFTAKTIIPLANNIELLHKTLKIANDEVENTTALEEEFNAVLGTFNNQWIRFNNNVTAASKSIATGILPSLTSLIQAANDSDAVSKLADALGTVSKIVVVGGSLHLGMKALPMLISAANATMATMRVIALSAALDGMATLTTSLWGTSVAAEVAAGNITKLGIAVKSAFAIFIGFQIGTWFHDNFAVARVAGAAFVGAMLNGFERMKFAGQVTWETFSHGFDVATSTIKKLYADLLSAIGTGLDAIGADDMAASYKGFADQLRSSSGSAQDLATKVASLKKEMDKNIKFNDTIIDQMIEWEANGADVNTMLSELNTLTEENANALEGNSEELETNSEAVVNLTDKIEDNVLILKEQLLLLGKTDRQLAIHEALVRASTMATGQNLDEEIRLINAYHDKKDKLDRLEEASKKAADAQEELQKAVKDAAKQAADDWAHFSRDFGRTFADMLEDGKDGMDAFKDSWKRMLQEMAGQLALSGVMKLFGINVPGGSSSGISGVLGSSGVAGEITKGALTRFAPELAASLGLGATAATATASAGAAGLAGGGSLTTLAPGLTTAAGWSVPTAGAGAAGAGAGGAGISSVLAAIPGWGWAIMGVAALGMALNKKSTPSFNAGFTLTDLPGVSRDRKFDIDPFESGLTPTGFNRRSSVDEAKQVTDKFRAIDSAIVKLVESAGLSLKLSGAAINGLSETGLGKGQFFGAAGEKGRPGTPLEEQLGMFARELISKLRGQIDDAELDKILGMKDIGNVMNALEKTIKGMTEATKEAEKAAKEVEEAEKKLAETRKQVINDNIRAWLDVAESQINSIRSLRSDIRSDLGIEDFGTGIEGEINKIAHLRQLHLTQFEEEVKQAQELHEKKVQHFKDQMRASEELAKTVFDLTIGDSSPLSTKEKLGTAKDKFFALSQQAANGDVESASQLNSLGRTVIDLARQEFASSQGFVDVFKAVTGRLSSVQDALSSAKDPGEFVEPSRAPLEEALMDLDRQLASIHSGIVDTAVSKLEELNIRFRDLPQEIVDKGLALLMSEQEKGSIAEQKKTNEEMIKLNQAVAGLTLAVQNVGIDAARQREEQKEISRRQAEDLDRINNANEARRGAV